jgi:hypothetical protein
VKEIAVVGFAPCSRSREKFAPKINYGNESPKI